MIKKIYLSQRHSFTCVLTIQIYVTSIPTYSHEYTTKEIQTAQPMTCLVPFSKSYTFFQIHADETKLFESVQKRKKYPSQDKPTQKR